MPPADLTPPADDFPAGQTGDMREVLLSPPTEEKPASAPAGPWQPPSAEELQKLLPQYEITALLGRGGMGAVYKGVQTNLDRPVAIKILSNRLEEADASFAERFKNEARAMAKLSHPGIVGVYDFGETAGGLLYIVMEFIEGTDVARMLAQQKRLHTEHAMAITAHVCDALAYAHERGIIHRDIKPANIMVGYDGVVKVADFGLAKMSSANAQSGLTQSGMAMGTLHYMAPEALMLGAGVDHRADVYAVGVMLYQMLTGKLPQGMFELPSLQVPGLDPRYDGIIAKALRDDRDLRYPRVLDMRHDLDAILTQPVVKVEAAAAKAPAALETQARPQRPGGQPYRPPQPEVIVRTEKKGSPLLWGTVVTLAALAAWLYLNKTTPESASKQPPAITDNQPAATKPPAQAASESSAATTPNPTEATKDRAFVNSLGKKFVPVPGTKVLFCIHEVRCSDYAAYAAESPGVDGSWKDQTYDGYALTENKENHPVMKVSWEDAQKFCAWLSKKEGKTYRLPTDQEWSYAVGIGRDEKWQKDTTPATVTKSQTDFPWGDKWPPPEGAGNYSDESRKAKTPNANAQYLENYDDGFPNTAPVMSFKPNKLGIYDLEGNVREWVEDWYDNSKADRVLRGGSWFIYIRRLLLSSHRYHVVPGVRSYDHGFRCVLELANQPNLTTKAPVVPPTTTQPPPATQMPATKAESATSALPTGPTTWTDTKGRSITATFKALASGNVVLDIAGKVTPVPLNTLSAESQMLARAYHDQSSAAAANDPAQATKDKPFTNTLGMKFVPVPGTKVLFCIHETRRQDYAAYSSAISGVDDSWKNQRRQGIPCGDKDDHPVVGVNFADSQMFCEWLGKKEGVVYRLPTDGEWSIAVGLGSKEANRQGASLGMLDGGETTEFPWEGDYTPKTEERAGNYADTTWHDYFPTEPYFEDYTDGFATTAPVMSFKPNRAGLYDMGGNVMEWVNGWWDNARTRRGYRGSSFRYSDRLELLSSDRFGQSPDFRYLDRGFRVVLELAAPSSAAAPTTAPSAVVPPAAPATAVPVPARASVSTATPASATKDAPFTNTLGMKFVPVPGTKVLFCIHETRQKDYAAFSTGVPGVYGSWKNPISDYPQNGSREDHPVFRVSWEDARAFCAWLGGKEGYTYRLPTDEEWSYAVGIGKREKRTKNTTPESLDKKLENEWPWGSKWPPPKGAGNFYDNSRHVLYHSFNPQYIVEYDDGFMATAPVMSFEPNDLGLYDLGGNVREWVDDCISDVSRHRVFRGSGWSSFGNSSNLLSSYRGSNISTYRNDSIGFRIVLEMPAP